MLATDDDIAIISALWFYQENVLNKLTINSATTVKAVSEIVNGGENGLEDRKKEFTHAKDEIDCE